MMEQYKGIFEAFYNFLSTLLGDLLGDKLSKKFEGVDLDGYKKLGKEIVDEAVKAFKKD